jgi:hypothetical protein
MCCIMRAENKPFGLMKTRQDKRDRKLIKTTLHKP